jgi:hypothetical protein
MNFEAAKYRRDSVDHRRRRWATIHRRHRRHRLIDDYQEVDMFHLGNRKGVGVDPHLGGAAAGRWGSRWGVRRCLKKQ